MGTAAPETNQMQRQTGSQIIQPRKRFNIKPEILKIEDGISYLTQADAFSLQVQKMLENYADLQKRATDWKFFMHLQSIVSSNASPDYKMLTLNGLLPFIKKHDEKMSRIIEHYVKNRQRIHEILQFVYNSVSTAEGLRRLFANIDAVLDKMKELKDRSMDPVINRLELLKKIFDKIGPLERDFEMSVKEQERVITGLIRTIELGISDNSWRGFIGDKSLGENTEIYIRLFKDNYGNYEFADMLERNKKKYGASNPEKWLGEKQRWQEWPDSLWYMYHNIRSATERRIKELWAAASRIAQSTEKVLEDMIGKSPSIALEDVKSRLVIVRRNIESAWEKKKKEFLDLTFAARLRFGKVEKILPKIKGLNNHISRAEQLAALIENNIAHEEQSEPIARVIETSMLRRTDAILRFVWNLRARERNSMEKLRLFNSNEEELADETGLYEAALGLINEAKDSYKRLLEFIEALNIGVSFNQQQFQASEVR